MRRFHQKRRPPPPPCLLPAFRASSAAFAAAADWALYHLSLTRVVAKCLKENEASRRMLSASMRLSGEDETYFYFEKTV